LRQIKTKMAKKKAELNLKDVIIEAIKEKKGQEIVVINLKELKQSIADYFIICHGSSNTQVETIADFIERQTRTEIRERPLHVEGTTNAQWVLLDYSDVIVHIFQESYRRFYNLEDLWADAHKEVIITD
jgi:ribosome-associated protein